MIARGLIIQSADEHFLPFVDLAAPIHARYATRHGAHYELFVGWKDPEVHPSWNRAAMFLEAFARGYSKVVWFDADTLVVDQEADIFAETADDVPLLMPLGAIPWGDQTWCFNAGVAVANSSPAAYRAFEYVWARRHAPLRDHHLPELWELNWLLDWSFAHRESVDVLSDRWNWQETEDREPDVTLDEAAVLAWHGISYAQRLEQFSDKVAQMYGASV